MNERVARREQMVKRRVYEKQAEQANRRRIWAKRKLILFVVCLVIAGGILMAVTAWFGVNVTQLLSSK